MEQMLIKLARQLDSLDEASLLSLWEKYANVVSQFEPSKRWEEAALVFSLIQAKQWKNQLFNHHWSHQTRPRPMDQSLPATSFVLEREAEALPVKKAKVLAFRSRNVEQDSAAPPEE